MTNEVPAVESTVSHEAYEEEHVHQVYEQIAPHFSATRYKPWPIVADFLQSLLPGSVGMDVGCGNGKYFDLNKDVFIVGSDRSENLARIASSRPGYSDCFVADGLDLPHPINKFDFAISIAVVHHFAARSRRIAAVKAILAVITPKHQGGKALIFVWALEQQNSRRGWNAADEQDVMVPWVTKSSENGPKQSQTFHRYYHLYRDGELAEDVASAGGLILDSGYDRDNWWVVAAKQ